MIFIETRLECVGDNSNSKLKLRMDKRNPGNPWRMIDGSRKTHVWSSGEISVDYTGCTRAPYVATGIFRGLVCGDRLTIPVAGSSPQARIGLCESTFGSCDVEQANKRASGEGRGTVVSDVDAGQAMVIWHCGLRGRRWLVHDALALSLCRRELCWDRVYLRYVSILVDVDAGYSMDDYVNAPMYGGVATLDVQAGEDEHDASYECTFCVYL
ncbi:hypothetical protein NE237_016402 [Protea cynaroides]|uniref:Uncharacterized protein n=1 Tax=Protea cynaroides TaxID=273540 RepID=A0A9Q0HGX7_9MAGN|nr:hypothetical protein NE237_016402 [Protea cynaroides]